MGRSEEDQPLHFPSPSELFTDVSSPLSLHSVDLYAMLCR